MKRGAVGAANLGAADSGERAGRGRC